jgi:hypothetical protein
MALLSIETIARTALQRDSLQLRSLVQDFLRSNALLATIARPATDDQSVLALSAALLELLALRSGQSPPVWTKTIGAADKPFYLLKSAERMKRLQQLCRRESPEPLRKRKFYAPPDYLTFV